MPNHPYIRPHASWGAKGKIWPNRVWGGRGFNLHVHLPADDVKVLQNANPLPIRCFLLSGNIASSKHCPLSQRTCFGGVAGPSIAMMATQMSTPCSRVGSSLIHPSLPIWVQMKCKSKGPRSMRRPHFTRSDLDAIPMAASRDGHVTCYL